MINKINPRHFFLIDGLGALLSTFLLGFVLVKWQDAIGMPTSRLYLLATIAAVFCLYSLCCFFSGVKNWRRYLRIIAVSNLAYCVLTTGFMMYEYANLTALGMLYFVSEIIIIVTLAIIELRIAKFGRKVAV